MLLLTALTAALVNKSQCSGSSCNGGWMLRAMASCFKNIVDRPALTQDIKVNDGQTDAQTQARDTPIVNLLTP